MPFEEIKNALLAMDQKTFSEAHLKQLLLYAPDSKEVKILQMFFLTAKFKLEALSRPWCDNISGPECSDACLFLSKTRKRI